MRKRLTLIGVLAPVVAMALATTGCSGNPSPAKSGAASGTITVVSNAGSNTRWVEAAAKAFQKKYPKIKVVVNAVANVAQGGTAVQTYSSSNAPDVGFMQPDQAGWTTLTKAHALTKVNDLWSESGLTKTTAPSVKPVWSVGGDQYGVVTHQVWAPVIYYNKSLFEKAGVTAPDGRVASMDAWDKMVSKLKAAGIQPLALGAAESGAEHITTALMQASSTKKEPYSDFLDNKANLSSGPFLTALKTIDEWNKDGVFAHGIAGMKVAQAESLFGSGGVAMLSQGSWGAANIIAQKPSFDWGWFLYPAGTSKSTFLSYVGNGMVIPSKAKNPAAAKLFVKFLVSKQGQELLPALGTVPIRNDLPDSALTDLPKQLREQIHAMKTLGSEVLWNVSPPAELKTALDTTIVTSILTGTKTPQQEADYAQGLVKNYRESQ